MSTFKIKKRDGTYADYAFEKVESAIRKTFLYCYGEVPKYVQFKHLHNSLDTMLENESKRNVEDIQDFVERWLMDHDYYDAAKRYILYREQHKSIRNWVNSKLEFINQYKNSSNTANATIDDNSNVSSKNIGIMNAEIHKKDNVQISRKMVISKLKELFPTFDSKQYVRDLEQHIIYKHDESSFAGATSPYCVALTMYPFLLEGIRGIGGLSARPKNLDSYCGMLPNMVFAIASQFAGAVALPEAILYFDYFARKEWGDDYYLHLDDVVNPRSSHPRTIREQIHQHFQQIVYAINQPCGSRGMQSAFTNFAYFDKPFFNGMFGEFMFPDNTRPIWESFNWLQKDFMMWFNEERTKCILTFPVESFALIYKDGKFEDEETAQFVAEEYARGHSFFTYMSGETDSLSSCCFDGDEVINITNSNNDRYLIKIKDFINSIDNNINKDGSCIDSNMFSIESFDESGNIKSTSITGILKKEFTGTMFDITTQENQHIQVTEDHLILVKNKETGQVEQISAEELSKQSSKYLIAVND